MKLPEESIISAEKITDYLLRWQPDSDKSQFLALAGYVTDNWNRLRDDIRNQILPLDAKMQRQTPYGDLLEIRGELLGPNGTSVRVVTIWMTEHRSGQTKFITLFPDREG